MQGKKNKDGTWDLEIEITDDYDFTEFVNPFLEEYTVENLLGKQDVRWRFRDFGTMFGLAATGLAYFSQISGAITPFKLIIHFTMKNYKVKENLEV